MFNPKKFIAFLSAMRTKKEIMKEFDITMATVNRWLRRDHGEYAIERTVTAKKEFKKFRLTKKGTCYTQGDTDA